MAKPLPPLDVPVLTPNGLMNQAWFEYFQGLQSTVGVLLAGAPEPTFSVPALTPGNTTVSLSAGVSKGSSLNPAGGVGTILVYDSGAVGAVFTQNAVNALATTSSALTLAQSNDNALGTGISGLNARVTALENKVNAVINDLAARFP